MHFSEVMEQIARGFEIVGALVLIGLYTLVMLWWSYSDGDRAGVLQKFSKRGWICKTWEGEVAQYVVGGVAPQIWNFSVRDAAVAEQNSGGQGQAIGEHGDFIRAPVVVRVLQNRDAAPALMAIRRAQTIPIKFDYPVPPGFVPRHRHGLRSPHSPVPPGHRGRIG